VIVKATNSDAVIDEIYAIAKGPKSFPATPESDNNGRKTRTIITVANTTDFLTSIEELKTT
jgi:hypothetical protein|tara:strand:- start:9 stop:191 length:183 start_codon:yes stop_codon:yes gene_type:complete